MLRNPTVFAVAGLGDLLCCFSKRMGGRGTGGKWGQQPRATPELQHWLSYAMRTANPERMLVCRLSRINASQKEKGDSGGDSITFP